MYKKNICSALLDGGASIEPSPYLDVDPSGRYGRFEEVLGKGAMKTVYRAFDEVLGMEVAWNQVKLNEVFRAPEALQCLYSEVHLLRNLNHESIIRYCSSWIDEERNSFNFITEMFTSGTLREYRRKYQKVDIRAIKRWARQILNGLAYLHGHDPPVIHRDLKCDNIFINGHLGQVKIGDLGLAAILRGSQNARGVIGTPEFMAPELYEEDYNELVDIYSFGMCVLEMLTGEYPYSECSNTAHIYKKVTSGNLPQAFYRIQNTQAQRFVGKCLQSVSKRLPAKQLLLDPFLAAANDLDFTPSSRVLESPFVQNLSPDRTVVEQLSHLTDMSITGTMNPDDNSVFLQVQISDEDGQARNIHFPFDIMNDTSVEVALEMVRELEITDWEPLEIAEMIEEEISSFVPNWRQLHHSSYSCEDDDENGGDGKERRHSFCMVSSSCCSRDKSLQDKGDSSLNSSFNSSTYKSTKCCFSENEEEEEGEEEEGDSSEKEGKREEREAWKPRNMRSIIHLFNKRS